MARELSMNTCRIRCSLVLQFIWNICASRVNFTQMRAKLEVLCMLCYVMHVTLCYVSFNHMFPWVMTKGHTN